MKRPLEQQTALVTGGNTGIGAAISEALADAGAKVVVNYHSHQDKTDSLLSRLREKSVEAIAVQGDVRSEGDVVAMFDRAIEKFGGIDILCANAGIERTAKIEEMTLKQWQEVIDVNLTGAFLCAREAARRFLRQGVSAGRSKAAGKVIFTSSVHEIIPWSLGANYCASKGGMQLLMKSMAQELAPHKIRVMGIGPGSIKTKFNADAWETKEKEQEEIDDFIPYGRWGEPSDIGRVAAWLASDEADYITGTTIFVDGGMLLYPSFRD